MKILLLRLMRILCLPIKLVLTVVYSVIIWVYIIQAMLHRDYEHEDWYAREQETNYAELRNNRDSLIDYVREIWS